MSKCELCGEPMPAGEEMFKYHGYSGPCPKPPLPQASKPHIRAATIEECAQRAKKYCHDHEANGIAEAVAEHIRAPQGAEMSEWQPIYTAPKDGTHILVWQVHHLGIRFTNQTNPPTVAHWFDDPEEPGFYTSVNEFAPEHPIYPTHWMPLPEPPK